MAIADLRACGSCQAQQAVRDLAGVQEQQHFIGPVLTFEFLGHAELNVGVGFGLTDASDGTCVKSIVGWTF